MVAGRPPGWRARTSSAAADVSAPADTKDPDEVLAEALSVAGHELAQPLSVALACAKLLSRESITVNAELNQEVLDSLTRSLA
jgi:hypothetical protein